MKKILFLTAAVALFTMSAGAQVTTFKLDKKGLMGYITRSDEDIANPKRAERGLTWVNRGDAMFNAAGYMLTQIYPGQPEKAMVAALGKAEPTAVELSGRSFQKYDYPYADVYVLEGIVQFWVVKDVVYEGAEDKAVEAYKKAAELDPKLKERASKGVANIGDIISIAANAQYNLGNQDAAADLYWKSFNVKKEPLVGKIDSVSVFNAGYMLLIKEEYDRAVPIFEAAIANNVWEEGKTPYFLAYALLQQKKFPEAKKVLDEGLKKFPGDKNMMESMVNYYAQTGGDFNEIKSELESSLEKDPNNQALWNGLGQVYIDEGDNDKSIEFFTKYVEKFPESPQSNFYLGDAWYGKADAIRIDAEGDTSMSKAARDAKIEESKEGYRKAWNYLKKAYEGNKEDAVLQRFTFTTYRLIDDPGMNDLYTNELEPAYKAMQERRAAGK